MIAATTVISAAGTRGVMKRNGIRTASAAALTASVRPLVLPISRTTSASCASGLRASMLSPSSLPSWPMTSTTATPWM